MDNIVDNDYLKYYFYYTVLYFIILNYYCVVG